MSEHHSLFLLCDSFSYKTDCDTDQDLPCVPEILGELVIALTSALKEASIHGTNHLCCKMYWIDNVNPINFATQMIRSMKFRLFIGILSL